MLAGQRIVYLLPLLLFLFLLAPELVERSMYNDGVAYAGLSKNLAHSIGTFWTPQLTQVEYVAFHEHPPLVFGIQSLFFRLLGDGLATERVYAFTIFALSAGLIVLLWREALRGYPEARRCWFIPLTLWLANEVVYHFYPANVLEPTVGLFALAAVWCTLRSVRQGAGPRVQGVLASTAAALLFAGSLCKGFVGLFPLAFYGLYWLLFRQITLLRAVGLTLLMVAVIGAAYGLLLQYEPARTSLATYFEQQVLGSLSGARTYDRHMRSDRFYIIRRAFELLIPALLLTAIFFGLAYRKYGRTLLRGEHLRYAYLLLGLGVCASFPLAISPKQSFYYLLPAMAYFALGLGLFLAPAAPPYLLRPWRPAVRRWMYVVMGILFLASLVNIGLHWGQSNRRDRSTLTDIEAMNTIIPRGTTIGSVGDMRPLNVYMWRTNEVSIDTAVDRQRAYPYLVAPRDTLVAGLDTVGLGLVEWRLYRVEP